MSETKTLEQYFSDWEGDTFGFGYGSGEEHILPALRTFFEAFKEDKRSYDYRDLEEACGPATAWLLINALCRVRCIEYGSLGGLGGVEGKSEMAGVFAEHLGE